MNRILICIAFLFHAIVSNGQQASLSDSIDQVLIKASRITGNLGDREPIKADLGLVEGLQHVSPIQVQSNGPGYLSTALIHGFGARHTAIVWNEVNIQSPINGTYDLSLINIFDMVDYTTKSLSANIGTAALGGAIMLDNRPAAFTTCATVAITDTNNKKAKLSHSLNFGKLNLDLGAHWVRNKNKFDFTFNDLPNRWNSRFDGSDFQLNTDYELNQKISFYGSAWIQRYTRDVPGSLVTNAQAAEQRDKNDRYQFGINYLDKNISAKLSLTHFDELLSFQTLSIDSRAKNDMNAILLSLKRKEHTINLSHRSDQTDANFFSSEIDRNLTQISYTHSKQWSSQISTIAIVSEQLLDAEWSPLLFDIGLSYQYDPFSLSLSVNRSYNTPTLNDLYWPQGGNQDLMPEDAIGLDLDAKYQLSNEVSVQLSPYYKQVSNWILWTPGEQFWSPKNQRQVISRGVDLFIKTKLGDKLNGFFNFSVTKATIDADDSFPELVGKQLIYVPLMKSSVNFDYSNSGFKLSPNFHFVSKRYLSTDNKASLPAYGLVDLSISQELALTNNKLTIGITAHNLLNKDYQQIRFYPMPLRYFELNLNFKTNK